MTKLVTDQMSAEELEEFRMKTWEGMTDKDAADQFRTKANGLLDRIEDTSEGLRNLVEAFARTIEEIGIDATDRLFKELIEERKARNE